MGQLNFYKIKRIFYSLKRQLIRFIPYKYKKPVYLISNIIGLLAYFNFMKSMTHSEYLYMVSNGIKVIQDLCNDVNTSIFPILIVSMLLYLSIRYCIHPSSDSNKTNKSLYREINALISFAYIGITILGFLPMILR